MSFIQTVKELYELGQKTKNIKIQEQITKLREEVIEIQEENIRLQEKISGLEKELSIRKNYEYVESTYWALKRNDDDVRDGPFCQRCFDVNKNIVRLQIYNLYTTSEPTEMFCLECKNSFFPTDMEEYLLKKRYVT